MREDYPEGLCRFVAYVSAPGHKPEKRLGELPGERYAYSGVIEPTGEPVTQAQYEREVRKKISHYKKISNVVRIETTWFWRYPVGHARGPHVWRRSNVALGRR